MSIAAPSLTLAGPSLGLSATRADAHALRLTRRGRLLRTVAVVLALALALALGSGALAGATAPERSVTIEPGQTLSHVAVTHLPEVPMARGVAMLQQANGLSSADVRVGQQIVLPESP